MALIHEIISWSEKLPSWQRDALRRLFDKPEGLASDDYEELYCMMKKENGIPGITAPEAKPLLTSHVPSDPKTSALTTLEELKDLQNVNMIAENQCLKFEKQGLNVIYGGNGSGKSGYARILKHVCRARGEFSKVLPNVHLSSSPGQPGATLVYSSAGQETSELAPLS